MLPVKSSHFIKILLPLILGIYIGDAFSLSMDYLWPALVFLAALLIFVLYKKLQVWVNISLYAFFIILGTLIITFKSTKDLGEMEDINAYVCQINQPTELKPNSYKTFGQIVQVKKDSVWKSTDQEILLYFDQKAGLKPAYGDVFLIKAQVREIEGPKNPKEFDYKTFMRRRGVLYHQFLRENDFERLGNSPPSNLQAFFLKYRAHALGLLQKKLSHKDDLAIAEAMILGTKNEMNSDLQDSYATAGVVHVLAVSGMHVGIILMLLNFIFGLFPQNRRSKIVFGVLSILIIWNYALFTGSSPSVIRATAMFSLLTIGNMLQKDKNSIHILAASCVLLLLYNPNWLFEVGFQLSYMAMLGILSLYPYLKNLLTSKYYLIQKIWELIVVSISAQIFTAPLSIYYFHQFPNYFLLTNPLITLSSMGVLLFGFPLIFLSGIPYLSTILEHLLEWSLKSMNFAVSEIAHLPFAKLEGISLYPWEVIFFYLLITLLMRLFILQLKEPLKLLLPALIFMIGFNFYLDFKQKNQEQLNFHFIPKGTCISMIDGKSAVYWVDSLNQNNPRFFNFHLKNYFDFLGINKRKEEVFDAKKAFYEFESPRPFLVIQNPNNQMVTDKFEVILIKNNAVKTLAEQIKTAPDLLIFDDSNKKARIIDLKYQADQLGWASKSLYETGAISL